MDATERAATVAAVSNRKRGELDRLAEVVGPPCTECRYERRKLIPTARGSDWKSYCGAPPAQNYRYDPVAGKMDTTTPITCASARSPGGLCGLEAEMFASKHIALIYAKEVGKAVRNAAYTIAAVLVAGGVFVAIF